MGFDPTGNWDWGVFGRGATWLAIGITAICVGVSVITCGAAAPAMVAVAAVTVAAATLTAVNGIAEIEEAATGHNFVKDEIFQGDEATYEAYANTTAAVAEIGIVICGGWKAKNAPRIEAYNNISTYKYGNSAAKHIGERSYYDSTLLKKQIVKYGKMTSEGGGVYTFRIGGTSFNALTQSMHSGTWELTVINSIKTIGHFLLRY